MASPANKGGPSDGQPSEQPPPPPQGRKGYIPEELQLQAKKSDRSPVVSEILVSARKGYTAEVLRELREGGAKRAAAVDKNGRSCLHLACLNGHFDTALAILQTELIDINSPNKRGLTPLHDASAEGHVRVVLLLLALGAYLHARTKDGWTCFMSACSNGHLQLAQLLMAAGSDLHSYTKHGLTALHISAWKGHASVVEMLVRAGCSHLAQSHAGKTALQLAQEERQKEACTILQSVASKHSEEPLYRISYLEGQLRLCQDKLQQAHRKHDELMTNERSRAEERTTNLKQAHAAELERARQRINELEQRVEKGAETPPRVMEVKVSTATPEGSPSHRRKKEGRRQPREHTRTPSDVVRKASIPNLSPLTPADRSRSASLTNLSEQGKEGGERETTNRSLEGSHQQQRASAGATITELVAESLVNPSSMSAIRKELKADALTPRIQRKFAAKPPPPSLPSMGGTTETSPLAKECTKASPRTSRTGGNSSHELAGPGGTARHSVS